MDKKDPDCIRVVILGGGLAGLSALHGLCKGIAPGKEIQLSFTLIEASDVVGGKVKSVPQQDAEGKTLFRHDLGPHSFRTKGSGKNTLQLVLDLGLAGELIRPSNTAHRRFLYGSGSLQELTMWYAMQLAGWKNIGAELRKGLTAASGKICRSDCIDHSVYRFLRSVGGTSFARTIGHSLTRGIYAGDPHDLSLGDALPSARVAFCAYRENLVGLCKEALFGGFAVIKQSVFTLYKSLLGVLGVTQTVGKHITILNQVPDVDTLARESPIYSFRFGMDQLPQALYECTQRDPRVQFMLSSKVLEMYKLRSKLREQGNKRQFLIRINTAGEIEEILADYVICALPSNNVVEVFVNSRPCERIIGGEAFDMVPVCDFSVHSLLSSIAFRSVHVANFFSVGGDKSLRNGFGYLTQDPRDPILGVIFDSSCFPSRYPKGATVCTAMLRPMDRLTMKQRRQLREDNIVTGEKNSVESLWTPRAKIEFSNFFGLRAVGRAVTVHGGICSFFTRAHQRGKQKTAPTGFTVHHCEWSDAIPQYTCGHIDKVAKIRELVEAQCPELSLCGCSYDGISVNDVILSGLNMGAKRTYGLIQQRSFG